MKEFFKEVDCRSRGGQIHTVRLYASIGQSSLLESYAKDPTFYHMVEEIANAIQSNNFDPRYGVCVNFCVEKLRDFTSEPLLRRIMASEDANLFKTEQVYVHTLNIQPEFDNDIGILNSVMVTVKTSKF